MKGDFRNIELLEAYYEGRMPEEERMEMEIRLLTDMELKADYELYCTLVEAMKDLKADQIRQELIKTDREEGISLKKPGFFSYSRAMAAVFLVLLLSGAAWYLLIRSPEGDYAALLPVEEGLPVYMTTTGEKSFDDAMSAFKQGDYRKAALDFEKLTRKDVLNDTLLYYTGNALLRDNRPLDAKALFEKGMQIDASVYREKAGYYHALCDLLTGKLHQSLPVIKQVAEDEAHPFRESAVSVLRWTESGK